MASLRAQYVPNMLSLGFFTRISRPHLSSIRAGLQRFGVFVLVLSAGLHASGAEPQTYLLSTYAGRAKVDGSRDIARFYDPGAITADSAGNAYVLDLTTLRKIDPDGSVRVIAGQWNVAGTNDGPANISMLGPYEGMFGVRQIAADTEGSVFIAEPQFHTVRKADSAGIISTYAGIPGVSGTNDGPAATATFNGPSGLCVDESGNIFVSDGGVIRKISRAGVVSTIPFSGADANDFDHSRPEYLASGPDGKCRAKRRRSPAGR